MAGAAGAVGLPLPIHEFPHAGRDARRIEAVLGVQALRVRDLHGSLHSLQAERTGAWCPAPCGRVCGSLAVLSDTPSRPVYVIQGQHMVPLLQYMRPGVRVTVFGVQSSDGRVTATSLVRAAQ